MAGETLAFGRAELEEGQAMKERQNFKSAIQLCSLQIKSSSPAVLLHDKAKTGSQLFRENTKRTRARLDEVQPKADVLMGRSPILSVGHDVVCESWFFLRPRISGNAPRDPCYLTPNHLVNQPCTNLLTSWGSLASLYASISARQAKVSICPGKEATRSSKIALAAARFRCRLKCVMALAYSVPRREGLAPKCRNLKSPLSFL
jgi:hypothetical protein